MKVLTAFTLFTFSDFLKKESESNICDKDGQDLLDCELLFADDDEDDICDERVQDSNFVRSGLIFSEQNND